MAIRAHATAHTPATIFANHPRFASTHSASRYLHARCGAEKHGHWSAGPADSSSDGNLEIYGGASGQSHPFETFSSSPAQNNIHEKNPRYMSNENFKQTLT